MSESKTRPPTTARRRRLERLREGKGWGLGLGTDEPRTALTLRLRGTRRSTLARMSESVVGPGEKGWGQTPAGSDPWAFALRPNRLLLVGPDENSCGQTLAVRTVA